MNLEFRAMTFRIAKLLLLVSLWLPLLQVQAQTASERAAATFFQQGVHLFEQGDLDGALEKFQLGMSIDDKNAAAHYYLAEVYSARNDDDKAKTHYEQAVELGPGTEQGIMAAAILSRQKKKEETLSYNGQFQMVEVSGGCFEMGSLDSDPERYPRESRHRVCVEDFRIGKYEVTQQEWQSVMGSNPSYTKGEDYPVTVVSWNDIHEFLMKLNSVSGRTYRLPTEAEWEYACRSGGRNELYCGGNDVDRLAWYAGNSGIEKKPVGGKQANGLGIHDMSGNVWEWTCSVYDSNYGGAETRCASQQEEGSRVFRGGSFDNTPAYVRAAFRYWDVPTLRFDLLGFRLAQDN